MIAITIPTYKPTDELVKLIDKIYLKVQKLNKKIQ